MWASALLERSNVRLWSLCVEVTFIVITVVKLKNICCSLVVNHHNCSVRYYMPLGLKNVNNLGVSVSYYLVVASDDLWPTQYWFQICLRLSAQFLDSWCNYSEGCHLLLYITSFLICRVFWKTVLLARHFVMPLKLLTKTFCLLNLKVLLIFTNFS
jgi:hypothetical protein